MQAYNDANLPGGYDEPARLEYLPERRYLSSGYKAPTRPEYVPDI